MGDILLIILIPVVIVGLILVLIGVLVRSTNHRKGKEVGSDEFRAYFDARLNAFEVRLLQLEAHEEASAAAMGARLGRIEELLEEIRQELRVV